MCFFCFFFHWLKGWAQKHFLSPKKRSPTRSGKILGEKRRFQNDLFFQKKNNGRRHPKNSWELGMKRRTREKESPFRLWCPKNAKLRVVETQDRSKRRKQAQPRPVRRHRVSQSPALNSHCPPSPPKKREKRAEEEEAEREEWRPTKSIGNLLPAPDLPQDSEVLAVACGELSEYQAVHHPHFFFCKTEQRGTYI